MLLAFALNVNFQPADAVTPSGYVADSGQSYADRGNGYTYGWNGSNNSTRDRQPDTLDNQLDDTLIHLQNSANTNARWEIAVPSGWYEVRVVAGDPSNTNSVYRTDVEGLLAVNATPSTNTRMVDGTVQVQVTDGRLTVGNAAGASNNKISHIEIKQLDAAPTVYNVIGYGPGGLAARDDALLLQSAINNLAPGGTLVLEPRTYLLNRGLVISKPVRIEGQNATLTLNTRAWPENQTLRIDSKLATTTYKWTGAIDAGATTLNVRIPTSDLKAGDMIWLGLGQDPNDANEEHYGTVARVIANTGQVVTIDTPIPRKINQGTRQHAVRKVTSLAENVTIRNVRFDHTSAALPDINVNVYAARNVNIENIGGRFTILTNVADSEGVSLENIDATLLKLHPAAGRLVTAWQSGGISVNNAVVNTVGQNPVVFMESWNRSSAINDLTVNWNSSASSPTTSVIHIAGGSAQNSFNSLRVNNPVPILLASTGGQAGQYTFGQVTITGTAKSIPFHAIADLTYKGTRYVGTTTTKEVALKGGWKDYSIPLVKGLVKKVTITVTDGKGVKNLFVLNDRLQGGALSTGFTSGKPITWTFEGWLGTDHGANDPKAPNWTVRVYTDAAVAAGAKLIISTEYVPL